MTDPFTQDLSCLHSRCPIVVRSMMVLVLTESVEVPLDTVREAFRAHHPLPSNLELVKTVRQTGWVTGIAGISECEIAACANEESTVVVINIDTGTSTVLAKNLNEPYDVTFIGNGVGANHVYVIETGSGTILKTISGFAENARGIVMLDESTLAVADKDRHGILLLPLYMTETCAEGRLIGQDHLCVPTGLCVLGSMCFAVVDCIKESVSLIDREGALLRVVRHISFGPLYGICNIGGGMVAIADLGNRLHIVSLDTDEASEIVVKSMDTPESCVGVCLMGGYLVASMPSKNSLYVLQ